MAHQKHKRGSEKNKKNKRRKYRKRKIVIQSVSFLKERFTDTGGWTTLMPQRKMQITCKQSHVLPGLLLHCLSSADTYCRKWQKFRKCNIN